MVDKRSKYDTDPLDPDFVRRTEQMRGDSAATGNVGGERPTEAMPPLSQFNEDPTRRLEDVRPHVEDSLPRVENSRSRVEDSRARVQEPAPRPDEQYSTSYPSVFVPPVYQPPANYSPYANATPPPHAAQMPRSPYQMPGKPSSRRVPGIGLPENVASVLPYAPFYIGIVAALIELLLVPRNEQRTRFHAAQGLALQLAILLISFAFGALRFVTDSNLGGWLFSLAAFIFLLVSMFRVWKGETHHISPLDELTGKINQQFEPRHGK